MFKNDKYDRFTQKLSEEEFGIFSLLTRKVKQELIDHICVYESIAFLFGLRKIDMNLRDCYFDKVEPKMSRPRMIQGYWVVLCGLNGGKTILDNMNETNRIFCYYLMQIILTEEKDLNNVYFHDIVHDVRELASSEALSLDKMIYLVDKVQEKKM